MPPASVQSDAGFEARKTKPKRSRVPSKYMAFGRPEVALAAMSWHELMFGLMVPTPAFATTPTCVPPCGT
jgi:hypothetical protein